MTFFSGPVLKTVFLSLSFAYCFGTDWEGTLATMYTNTHNLTKSSTNHNSLFRNLRAVQLSCPPQKTTPCFIFCCFSDVLPRALIHSCISSSVGSSSWCHSSSPSIRSPCILRCFPQRQWMRSVCPSAVTFRANSVDIRQSWTGCGIALFCAKLAGLMGI